jgi:hypothetical protein
MSIQYTYYDVKWDRDKYDPVTKEEYEVLKTDLQGFLIRYEDAIRKEQEELPPPNKIKWPVFFVFIGLSSLTFILGKFFIKDSNIGGWFKAIGAICTVMFIGFPLIAVMRGNLDTKLHVNIKIGAIDSYYKRHAEWIMETNSYEEYLEKVEWKKFN